MVLLGPPEGLVLAQLLQFHGPILVPIPIVISGQFRTYVMYVIFHWPIYETISTITVIIIIFGCFFINTI